MPSPRRGGQSPPRRGSPVYDDCPRGDRWQNGDGHRRDEGLPGEFRGRG